MATKKPSNKAATKYRVIDVAPPESPPADAKRSRSAAPAWNISDLWPGSASVASVQGFRDRTVLTVLIEKKKPQSMLPGAEGAKRTTKKTAAKKSVAKKTPGKSRGSQ